MLCNRMLVVAAHLFWLIIKLVSSCSLSKYEFTNVTNHTLITTPDYFQAFIGVSERQCQIFCDGEKFCVAYHLCSNICFLYGLDVGVGEKKCKYKENCFFKTKNSTYVEAIFVPYCEWRPWNKWGSCTNNQMSRMRTKDSNNDTMCEGPNQQSVYCGDSMNVNYSVPLPYSKGVFELYSIGSFQLEYCFHTDAKYHDASILVAVRITYPSTTYYCGTRDFTLDCVNKYANIILPSEFVGEYAYVTKDHINGETQKAVAGCTFECIQTDYYNYIALTCCKWNLWGSWQPCTNQKIIRTRTKFPSDSDACVGSGEDSFYCDGSLIATYSFPYKYGSSARVDTTLKGSQDLAFCFFLDATIFNEKILIDMVFRSDEGTRRCNGHLAGMECISLGAKYVLPTEFVGEYSYLTKAHFDTLTQIPMPSSSCTFRCRRKGYKNGVQFDCSGAK